MTGRTFFKSERFPHGICSWGHGAGFAFNEGGRWLVFSVGPDMLYLGISFPFGHYIGIPPGSHKPDRVRLTKWFLVGGFTALARWGWWWSLGPGRHEHRGAFPLFFS